MSLQVAILSDIHGNFDALSAVLDELEQQEIQKIIVAGDSTGPTMQNHVFKALLEKKAILIRGNGEQRIVRKNRAQIPERQWSQIPYTGNRWAYNDLEPSFKTYLEFLPDQRVVEYEGTNSIRVVHGSPLDTNNAHGILPEQTSTDSQKIVRVHRTISIEDAVQGLTESVLVCGHTHRPWVHRIEDKLIVNPGSVGNPCNGDPRADYAVLTWSKDQWSVEHKAVSYDLESVYSRFHGYGVMETVGAFARSTLLCRLTGIDVTLEFLIYVRDLQSEKSLSYDQAYSAATTSFDWKKYEK